jgi:ABC-type phosphate transport system substrate-binding protein
MQLTRIARFLLAGFGLLLAAHSRAEIVVIVAASSPIATLSPAQVSDIFLCKSATFPGGSLAVPLDQAEGSPIRLEFYNKTTGKTPELLKAYWSKMIFTGQGEPPREIADSEKIKKLVANNPHYIGYVDKSAVDSSVKMVLSIR